MLLKNILKYFITNKIVIIVALFLISVGSAYYYYTLNKKNVVKLELAINNTKAYSNELNKIKDKNIEFKFSIELLKYFNDSINNELLKTVKNLRIKEKKVASLQYLLSTASKTDTIEIILKDTIFKDNTINIDTIMGDKWYTLKLGLRFPNKIIVSPSFESEKHIISYDQKEYVEPPKKFFLCRWFQKKHTVRHVEVYEKSPYVNDSVLRFIEIVK